MLRNFLCYVCFLSLVVVNSSLFFLAMFKVLITFLLFSAHAHYCVLGTFVLAGVCLAYLFLTTCLSVDHYRVLDMLGVLFLDMSYLLVWTCLFFMYVFCGTVARKLFKYPGFILVFP